MIAIFKKSPELFKLDSKGNIRVWSAEVGFEGNDGFVRTTYGLYNGEHHTTTWSHCEATNKGRSNERSSLVQAIAEMNALIQAKLTKERYTTDPSGVTDFPAPKPMLAKEYDKYKNKIWEGGKIVSTQPKLDGIRGMSTPEGMFTRQGKDISSCPHILEELRLIWNKLPQLTFLDGELYNHDLKDDFQKITSLVRKKNVTKNSLEETEKLVQYHIYDVGRSDPFWVVWENLVMHLKDLDLKHIKIVPTARPSNQAELDQLYSDYLEQGYEGMMVRWGDSPYEEKRSQHLLKRKDFESDEFTVIRLEEGSGDWQGAAKRFVLRGRTTDTEFAAGVRGQRDDLKELWGKGEIPKWATIRYFGTSNDGVPRFPVVVDYGFEEMRSD